MNSTLQHHVEPCFRCGRPAEQPVIGKGHVAGRDEENIPLCVDCLQLLLTDTPAFWAGMRNRKG